MIVAKAVNMAKKMNIPIIGVVENMSYLKCPDCGKKISVFGESHIEEVASENGIQSSGAASHRPEDFADGGCRTGRISGASLAGGGGRGDSEALRGKQNLQ